MNTPYDAPPQHHHARHAQRPRRDRTVALVDARYLAWLAGRDDPEDANLDRLRVLLGALAESLGRAGDVARLYWYAAERPGRVQAGVVHRWVAPESADAGSSLTLAMARDLLALASAASAERMLLVTDDDRLLPVVDAAQMQGAQVALLADRSAEDLDELARTDASWAALLRQADERWTVDPAEVERALWGDGRVTLEGVGASAGRHGERPHLGGLRGGSRSRGPELDAAQRQEIRDALQPMVMTWWSDLPLADRQGFKDELPALGLPQEADRHLLLRLSQQLGRPLSLPEKKAMRELAREAALGPADTAMAASDDSLLAVSDA